MMYANIRGADGTVLGNVAVDPTAPGGLQGALNDAVQRLQNTHGTPVQHGRPIPPGLLPPGGYPGPQQAVSQSMPFVCQLRYLTRAPNGATGWAVRSIPCPVGLPPGVYTLNPGQGY
jgi:hypothetical protein